MGEHTIAAQSSQLSSGTMLAVTVQKTELIIFRDRQGAVHAVRDRCSHAEVRLSDGTYDGEDTIECPAHGAQFSVCSGRALCMPAVSPVQRFPCHEQDGNIYVNLE